MSGAATKPAQAGTDIATIAEKAVAHVKKRGASDVSVTIDRRRGVECEVREGKVEKLQESNAASLSVAVFADGRFSSHGTSDLGWASLEKFLDGAVAMTRVLEADPFRSLPDPKWYAPQPKIALGLEDPGYDAIQAAERKSFAREIEIAARMEPISMDPMKYLPGPIPGENERPKIQSVSAEVGDSRSERVRITSNGFFGREVTTSFYAGASVTMREGLKRPEDYWYISSRKRSELGRAEDLGGMANVRARARLGAKKVPGGAMTVLVENRVAGRLLGFLVGAASAPALQQKRSFLDGKKGATITNAAITLTDDPLIPGALGSRLFDGEGIAARRMPFIEAGVLRNYFVDWYYGRKLGMDPTTGGPSNLVLAPGKRTQAEIESTIERGILVTSFLGGNSNGLTGDFSVGIQGALIEKGKRVQSIGEMNLAGNHKEFWARAVEVSSDPWLFSSMRTPALLLDGVSVAGA